MLYLCRLGGELFLDAIFFLLLYTDSPCSAEEIITPTKRKRVPSSKAAAVAYDSPPK
jgi:hypothetical protein